MQNLAFLFSYLLQGLGVTIGVTIIALSFGFVLGIAMALVRVYGSKLAAILAATYSTIIRALPVVLVIFILYFGISRIVDLSPFLSGAFALGFASTAYTRVLPGDKIVDIVDLSTVWIIADIYEPDLHLIKAGQQAKITLSYFPGKTFHSKIDFIYPFLAEATRSAKVRFSVPNPRTELQPQMFTTVEITIDLGKRLTVPESAVLDSGKRQIVYVDKGEGLFEPGKLLQD